MSIIPEPVSSVNNTRTYFKLRFLSLSLKRVSEAVRPVGGSADFKQPTERCHSGGPAITLTDCWGLNWIRCRFTSTNATETIRVVFMKSVSAPAWTRKRCQQHSHLKEQSTLTLSLLFCMETSVMRRVYMGNQ